MKKYNKKKKTQKKKNRIIIVNMKKSIKIKNKINSKFYSSIIFSKH